MSLPTLDYPTYTLTLPVSKKELKYRPFLVKEEKILLTAMQDDKDLTGIINSIKGIVNVCAFDQVDVDKLSSIDLEYAFVHMRMKSKGESVEARYKCKKKHDDVVCDTTSDVSINLEQIELVITEGHTDIIKLTPTLGIKMKYPNVDMISNLANAEQESYDSNIKLLIKFIDYIYDNDKIHHIKDQTEDEVVEFIGNMTDNQINKIKDFLQTMPKLVINVPFMCGKCGHEETIKLEGTKSFFA